MNYSVKAFQQILRNEGLSISSTPKKSGIDGIVGPLTKGATWIFICRKFKSKGFKMCNGIQLVEFRLNGFFTDKFSDIACVVDFDNSEVLEIVEWTTKPGKYWVHNPVTVGGIKGTGCVAEQQVLKAYKFTTGISKKSWAKAGHFRQIRKIKIFRDANKDKTLDKNISLFAPTWYGFQKHRMGKGFRISNWSAGCTGSPDEVWYNQIAPHFIEGSRYDLNLIEI